MFRLQEMLYSIVEVEHNVSWKGLHHYLTCSEGKNDLKTLEYEDDCVIKVSKTSESPMLNLRETGLISCLNDATFQLVDKELIISNKDITDLQVDIVVVPTMPNLEVIGGVRRAVQAKGELTKHCFSGMSQTTT